MKENIIRIQTYFENSEHRENLACIHVSLRECRTNHRGLAENSFGNMANIKSGRNK
jgi:hypothetical protein